MCRYIHVNRRQLFHSQGTQQRGTRNGFVLVAIKRNKQAQVVNKAKNDGGRFSERLAWSAL